MIAVTGMAWETALGSDVDDVWRQLTDGTSGFREVPSEVPLRSLLAARLPEPVIAGTPEEQHVTVAVRTAGAALRDAGLSSEEASDLQVVIGTSLGPHADSTSLASLHDWEAESARLIGSSRPPITVSTACSSGNDALAVAGTLLAGGHADRCLVGAVDLLTPAKRQGHSVMGTMSPTTLRAFDEDRDGTLPGEGAAFLIVERASDARARGARVHGFLRGWGASNNAVPLNSPDASGSVGAQAVLAGLAMAGVGPDDIAVVCAHATATVQNDASEAEVLRRVFAGHDASPPVMATKGAFGHALGATGLIESIALLLALRHQLAPPIPDLRTPVPDFPLPLPVKSPTPFIGSVGLNLTLGIGGFNTCLVFQRGDAE